MRGIIFTSFLFCLSCSPQQPVLSTPNATAIVGGENVMAIDPISSSTVQIYTMIIKNQTNGSSEVEGVGRCTGVLISKDIILTAAHCLHNDPENVFVYFAHKTVDDFMDLFFNFSITPGLRRVRFGETPAAWKTSGGTGPERGDLALLRFAGDLPEGYSPIQMPTAEQQLAVSQNIWLAGYGWTDGVSQIHSIYLKKVSVPVVELHPTEMRVGSSEHGACHGDSGGPAYLLDEGQPVLVGITSAADILTDPKFECRGISVYTQVIPYLGWIQKTVVDLEGRAL